MKGHTGCKQKLISEIESFLSSGKIMSISHMSFSLVSIAIYKVRTVTSVMMTWTGLLEKLKENTLELA